MDNKTLFKELDNINQDYKKVEKKLINNIEQVGIEYVDLYAYISLLNVLEIRKNKIQYLIATNGLK